MNIFDLVDPEYNGSMSSDEIYYGGETNICLTDVIDAKSDYDHTHSEYAASDHTHSGYVSSDDLTALEDVVETKADASHSHTEYALTNHSHSDYALQTDFDALESEVDGKADATHTHDYAPSSHTHSEYSAVGHNHNNDYATVDHTHTNYATVTALDELSVTVSGKANASHNHDDVYDASGAAASALTSANTYTDSKINLLVGEGAAETLNTIGEISAAIEDNQDAIDLLNSAIGSKANATDLTSHANDTDIHITSAERTAWNAKSNFSGNYNDLTNKPTIPSINGLATETYVDEKVAAVTVESIGALPDTTVIPTVPANVSAFTNDAGYLTEHQSLAGLATETYVDEAVSAKANSSHSHAISDVTGLQSALDSKAASGHNHDSSYDVKGAANTALASAKDYTDDAIADEVIARDSAIATAKSSAISTAASDATTKADNALASAKTYADSVGATVKNDLLGNAGAAYDTLKELGDLIDENVDAIDALEVVASGKANAVHTHAISDITNLQSTLDGKAASSHGTHVSYSTTAPVMDGTASVGTASTVARSDHKHPTDTSRASQTDLDALETVVAGKANTSHSHAISDIANLQSTLDAKTNQNAFSNVKVGSTTIAADTTTDTLTLVAGTNVAITPDASGDSITISSTDTNTTYSAGTGISLSGTTFSNSGVRSIATGSANGTISVNTNGTSANVAVKGLGSAAYTDSTAYDAAGTAQTKADAALASAKAYTDSVKNDLLNGAGSAYDTLKELGDLIDENVDAIEALETVAASKASASDLTSHTSNKSNPHGVTLAQLGVTATTVELNYVDGVTSNIQTQLNAKQATITGGASTIASANLTSSRALVSDSSGKVAVSAVTSTELGYLDGVTSNVQTQLDAKAASSHTHSAVTTSANGLMIASDKSKLDGMVIATVSEIETYLGI